MDKLARVHHHCCIGWNVYEGFELIRSWLFLEDRGADGNGGGWTRA